MRAGDIARSAGLMTGNTRWCGVDWLTMESLAHKGIHVLGDATLSAPGMPKSGHMANNHAKIAAAGIVELLNGRSPQPVVLTATAVATERSASLVHRYDAAKTLTVVRGGGVPSARNGSRHLRVGVGAEHMGGHAGLAQHVSPFQSHERGRDPLPPPRGISHEQEEREHPLLPLPSSPHARSKPRSALRGSSRVAARARCARASACGLLPRAPRFGSRA
jgi:hypothetical protein